MPLSMTVARTIIPSSIFNVEVGAASRPTIASTIDDYSTPVSLEPAQASFGERMKRFFMMAFNMLMHFFV